MPYLYFALILLCVIGAFRLSRRQKAVASVFRLVNGHKYAYLLGDNLPGEAVRFHGMDITLPLPLTDFYLDASLDNRNGGPNMLFSRDQLVSLEGNFPRHFQLFVPKGKTTEVLSVLTPDVMQTLLGRPAKFDIQVHQNHLRIISPVSVYGMDGREIDLKWAAEAILPEIDHRLVSWRPNDRVVELRYKPGKTLKFGRWYVRRGQVLTALLLGLASIMAAGFSLAWYYTRQNPQFSDPYSKGVFAGLLMDSALWILFGFSLILPFLAFIWFFAHQKRIAEYLRALIGR
ncbi:hypothetical protein EYC59_03245 [Candidatus Saccharibacteria bacterium]|nr:MAG: hypothetical protein EYC59_03245 [Candidatus Saccharibacteria bacterium]